MFDIFKSNINSIFMKSRKLSKNNLSNNNILILGVINYIYLFYCLLNNRFNIIFLYFFILAILYIFLGKFSYIISSIFLLINYILTKKIVEGNLAFQSDSSEFASQTEDGNLAIDPLDHATLSSQTESNMNAQRNTLLAVPEDNNMSECKKSVIHYLNLNLTDSINSNIDSPPQLPAGNASLAAGLAMGRAGLTDPRNDYQATRVANYQL